MEAAIKHFLLVFDHQQDELVEFLEFGDDVKAATAKYDEYERTHRTHHAMDIVLVGSDSLDTVKVTHSNYFTGMSRSKINNSLDFLHAV